MLSLYKKVRFRSSRKLSKSLPIGMLGAATTFILMGFIFSQQNENTKRTMESYCGMQW
jgi:hypothetical protein